MQFERIDGSLAFYNKKMLNIIFCLNRCENKKIIGPLSRYILERQGRRAV